MGENGDFEPKNYVFDASQWRCFDEIPISGIRGAFSAVTSTADANVATLELSREQVFRRSARSEQLRMRNTEHEFDVMLRRSAREQSRFEADAAIVQGDATLTDVGRRRGMFRLFISENAPNTGTFTPRFLKFAIHFVFEQVRAGFVDQMMPWLWEFVQRRQLDYSQQELLKEMLATVWPGNERYDEIERLKAML